MSAKAVAIFEGDDSKLQKTLKHIEQSLLSVEERFARVHEFSLNVLEAIGLLTVAEKAFEGVKSVLEVGDHLNSLSQQTGVAVADLAVMEQQFKQSGLAAADMAGAVGHMQRNLSNGSGNAMLAQMGVELNELQKKSPAEQFKELGHAINGLKSPTDRAAAATAFFGKEGAALLPVFASHGFEEAAERVGAQAAILNEDAALFGDAGSKLNLAGLKAQGFFVGVADKVVPVLMPLLDRFEKLDLSGFGQQIGETVAALGLAVATGDIWPMIGEVLEIAFGGAVNFLLKGLLTVVGEVGAVLLETFGVVMDFLFSRLLDLLSLAAKIPGVKGAVSAGREGLAQRVDNTQDTADQLRGIGKYGDVIDTDAISDRLDAHINDNLNGEAAIGMVFKALHPTTTPEGGPPELGNFGDQGNFSALARIGGDFGGGGSGGDALLEATRDQTDVLREIRDRLQPADPQAQPPKPAPQYR